MKNLILTAFILTVLVKTATAQKPRYDAETKYITIDSVVTLEGKSATEIFDKTKAWFIEYFREAASVIRGEISPSMIKGTYHTTYVGGLGARQPYETDIVVRIKDGAIKIVIDDLMTLDTHGARAYHIEGTFVKQDGTIRPGGVYQKMLRDATGQAKDLMKNLVAYVNKKNDF